MVDTIPPTCTVHSTQYTVHSTQYGMYDDDGMMQEQVQINRRVELGQFGIRKRVVKRMDERGGGDGGKGRGEGGGGWRGGGGENGGGKKEG